MLVVGGSAGIGREVGIAALDRGARVVFGARRAEVLDEITRTHEGAGGVVMDVCDEDSVTRALAEAVAHLGGLDAVVHTAGVAAARPARRSGRGGVARGARDQRDGTRAGRAGGRAAPRRRARA